MNTTTVLIVEDNVVLADTLLFALSCADYQAEMVTTFADLQLYLQQNSVGAILLDLHLSGLTSQELISYVKQNCGMAKIIICTCDMAAAQPLGHFADAVFVKPLKLNQLDNTLQALLQPVTP